MADYYCPKCSKYTGPFHRHFISGEARQLRKPPAKKGEGSTAMALLELLLKHPEVKGRLDADSRCVRQDNYRGYAGWSWSIEPQDTTPIGSSVSMGDLLRHKKEWLVGFEPDGPSVVLSIDLPMSYWLGRIDRLNEKHLEEA